MTLQTLLKFAGRKVLDRRISIPKDITEVPERYKDVQVRAAVELFSKMGAEGQTSHSENSISRVWESADISNSVLAEIIPHAGVFDAEFKALNESFIMPSMREARTQDEWVLTGEQSPVYSAPVKAAATIAAYVGESAVESFGEPDGLQPRALRRFSPGREYAHMVRRFAGRRFPSQLCGSGKADSLNGTRFALREVKVDG